jgi:long-chain acyl-CoA synthetase
MNDERGRTNLTPEQAKATGMVLALHARNAPERMAIRSVWGERSFGELNAAANRFARLLQSRGLVVGDAVAVLCSNRPEFVEVLTGCQRAGFRVTPINWHLTGEEAGYIVANCEAKAFVADAQFEDAVLDAARRAPRAKTLLAIGGELDGFDPYAAVIAEHSDDDLEVPTLGLPMLYTSGTTGRPKGVYRSRQPRSALLEALLASTRFDPEQDVALCTGPLYHAAPLALNLNLPLAAGVGVVLMDGWDEEEALRLVQEHGVTHTHMVPTMFHRLLQLPEAVRQRYDTSSLRWVLHGAAPCPVHVKRAMIEWLGPVLFEYYAATEGGAFFIDSEQWLRKPGSVGRLFENQVVKILDDEGRPVQPGEVGAIYFQAPEEGRFEYFKAPDATAAAYRGRFFTMGDMGYLDEDRYLFLNGRSAEVIISGGVNIYPAEVDAVLLMHPAVADVASVGIPNEEWGEEVRAVVLPAADAEPGANLAAELIAHCRARLAHYKCPRGIDFVEELPRLPTGKILRRAVRARYWGDRQRQI